MTLEELFAKVRKWDLQNSSGECIAGSYYSGILNHLQYHAAREWRVYLPAERPGCHSSYMERLAAWIGNVPNEEDQKLLLRYAQYISFFSHHDFAALYRSAVDREVSRWIAGQIGSKLSSGGWQQFQDSVVRAIHDRTWFCPVTDSMDINEFYKVNHLTGVAHRPGFFTLQMLAEGAAIQDPYVAKNVRQYMAENQLERLVLLEDVVGSGNQCLKAVRWAVANIQKPVLFVPLILCPNGVETLRNEESASGGNLTIRPVIVLHRCDVLGQERQGRQGWPISSEVEQLVRQVATFASPGIDPFGYEGTGCSLATFANTPDNTLPIVHNRPSVGSWAPLFPRVYRD